MSSLVLIVALLVPGLASAAATHPLDSLDAQEIVGAVSLLRKAGHADGDTYFASISLREPPKATVLAWNAGEPILRAADVVMRAKQRTYAAVVDLSRGRVESFRELPGVQPSIGTREFSLASGSATADSRMREGFEKRGITDSSQLFCAPRSIGNFGEPEERSRRLVKVDCFDIRGVRTNVFATPIEGLFATVDLDTGEVLEVTDLGVLPLPPGVGEIDVESIGAQRTANPIVQSAPLGSNVRIDGSVVRWQKWSFHLRWDVRAGAIISQVSFDEGDSPRSVLYRGSMGEIFVPYQDPTTGWYFRNYMDEGDYGLGASGSELVIGSDCPAEATYLSPVMANSGGGADRLPNRICIFERSPGRPLWRHADIVSQARESRPALELIVRYIATVGNYDYVFDWLLDQTGSITFRGGATGIDSVKGVTAQSLSDPTAADDTAFGPLIAPGRAGINHDHFFSIRLDVDVDGVRNTFVRDTLVVEPQPEGGPSRLLKNSSSKGTFEGSPKGEM